MRTEPFRVFAPALEEELGPDRRRWFAHVGTGRPLGSASLAQVCRVTLHGGRPAVLKVQRPGTRARVFADMAALRRAARRAGRAVPHRLRPRRRGDTPVRLRPHAAGARLHPEAGPMVRARQAARDFSRISVTDSVRRIAPELSATEVFAEALPRSRPGTCSRASRPPVARWS